MKKYKKIVLAYSGGLDTTVAIPWLKQETGAEIIALCVDVGQPDNLIKAQEKALAAGAGAALIKDVKHSFAYQCLLPAIQANALYEGVYPLLSALSRPIIAEQLVKEAEANNADAVAHGCTGKGNDQLRFDLSLAALAPDLDVIAPARHWGFTREDSLKYAKSKGITFSSANPSPYSIDENLWGRAIECGDLEDAWLEPPEDAFSITIDPQAAKDEPKIMTIDFESGVPSALNGTALNLLDLIDRTGKQAGACGVGRIDHVESRVVGIKSREIYECPAALTILQAHKALEAMVLTREEIAFKAKADAAWADLVYEGKWHAPLRKELDAFIDATQARVTGSVRLKLYKGSMAVVGRKSPFSLYDQKLATYGADDPFDHGASIGFSKIACMEAATLARIGLKKTKESEVVNHDEIDMAETVSA